MKEVAVDNFTDPVPPGRVPQDKQGQKHPSHSLCTWPSQELLKTLEARISLPDILSLHLQLPQTTRPCYRTSEDPPSGVNHHLFPPEECNNNGGEAGVPLGAKCVFIQESGALTPSWALFRTGLMLSKGENFPRCSTRLSEAKVSWVWGIHLSQGFPVARKKLSIQDGETLGTVRLKDSMSE